MGWTKILNYTCFSPSTEFITAVFLLRQKYGSLSIPWLLCDPVQKVVTKTTIAGKLSSPCCVLVFSKGRQKKKPSLNSVVHSWYGVIHSGPGIIVSSFYRTAIGVEDKITGKERWRLTDRRGRLQYRRWTPTYKSDVTLPIIDDACSCGSFTENKYFEFARTFVQLR